MAETRELAVKAFRYCVRDNKDCAKARSNALTLRSKIAFINCVCLYFNHGCSNEIEHDLDRGGRMLCFVLSGCETKTSLTNAQSIAILCDSWRQ